MSERIRALIVELKMELAALYGDRLRGLYLYGSYARGEADDESDVDVIVVLDRVDDYSAEVERTGWIVSRLSLDHSVSISRVFVAESDWRKGADPFLDNAREEAIAA